MSEWVSKIRKKLRQATMAMDSLDSVELAIAIEETFDVTISDEQAEKMATPRHVIDWLLERVSQTGPNKHATGLLRKVAIRDNCPELANMSGGWTRPQIAAVVRELITDWTGAKSFTEESSFIDDIYS